MVTGTRKKNCGNASFSEIISKRMRYIYYQGNTFGCFMWKILGADSLYVEFADIWKKRITEVVSEGIDEDNGNRFVGLMKDSEVLYMMNGSTEVHTFMVQLPETLSPEDIQFLSDVILDVANTYDEPFVSLNGNYEKCQVIFTTEKEPELIGLDKTKGYSSGAVFAPILKGWGNEGRQNETFM
ncbi:MAG: hypothetical protein FWG58_05260 [Methanomassiliicoccaceae archaeon]|nr:hypothetical protein [Methanomassiliicoccaceae archaeon]